MTKYCTSSKCFSSVKSLLNIKKGIKMRTILTFSVLLFCVGISNILANPPTAASGDGVKPLVEVAPGKTQQSDNASTITQYKLNNGKAKYVISPASLSTFSKMFSIAEGGENHIIYSLKENTNGRGWNLSVFMVHDNEINAKYLCIMNEAADVSEEKATVKKTEIQFKPVGGKGGIHDVRKIKTHTEEEKLVVSLENQLIFGKSKVLRYYTERKTRGKLELDTELMIAPEEIVTTFTQLPIYIGTLQSLPINGIKVRWTAFGKPLPVRVKLKTASDGGRWYEVYKEEPASDEGVASEGGQLLVKLFYNNEKPGFSFPSQIVLLVGGNEMVMQKAEEN